MNAYVVARCVACKRTRKIGPGEVPEGQLPICEHCGNAMTAEKAVVARVSPGNPEGNGEPQKR